MDTATKTVLIADDYPDTAEAYALLLQTHGYETFVARNGIEALDMARALQPQAVLLDVSMPGLDGLEVCRRLRGELWAGSMLIIAITGWSDGERCEAALEAGCDHCLIKPVHIDQLRKLLDSGLPAPA